ncbi:MAG: hypothetical protein HGB14_08405 [Anaerolineaceae bacterium]|nr:hypothetical protein [Anaerolineaceae bacterium]
MTRQEIEKEIKNPEGIALALLNMGDIYFNQEQIGPIGEIGEVKYLIFSSDQTITTPTAQFTFTPTLTTNPTSTLRPTNTLTTMPATPSATVTPYIP